MLLIETRFFFTLIHVEWCGEFSDIITNRVNPDTKIKCTQKYTQCTVHPQKPVSKFIANYFNHQL